MCVVGIQIEQFSTQLPYDLSNPNGMCCLVDVRCLFRHSLVSTFHVQAHSCHHQSNGHPNGSLNAGGLPKQTTAEIINWFPSL